MAPERFLVQFTIGRSTHDKLQYAQALLSHEVPPGDVAQVLDRALDELNHFMRNKRDEARRARTAARAAAARQAVEELP